MFTPKGVFKIQIDHSFSGKLIEETKLCQQYILGSIS